MIERPLASGALCAAAIAFVAWASLSGWVPLTYDEAWNWSNVASRGVATAFSRYDVQNNNHVLFSLVQCAVPAAAVLKFPPLLRLGNVAVAAAVILLCTVALRRLGVRSPWVPAALLVASPVFTPYLFVARGYLLGTALVGAAAWLAARDRHPAWIGVLAGLAAATVSTFGYAMPAFLWNARRSRKQLLLLVAGFAAVVVPVYAPKIGVLSVQRNLLGNSRWLSDFFQYVFVPGRSLPSAILLGALAGWVAWRARPLRSASGPRVRTAWLLLQCAAAFIGCVVVLAMTGLANAPFPRVALMVPLFAWAGLTLLAFEAGGAVWGGAQALLALNAAWAAWLLATSFPAGRSPEAYPLFAFLSAPPMRAAMRLHPLALRAGWSAEPVASLYGRSLGIPVEVVNDIPQRCDAGKVSPGDPTRRVAAWADGRWRPACY